MEKEIKFLDVVKWDAPMTEVERHDVMVVEDVDGDFLTVRHIGANSYEVGTAFAHNVRVVGHCTAHEPMEDIAKRYMNK